MDLFQLIRIKENATLREALSSTNVNQTNEYSECLLHEAIAYANEDAANLLLSLGVDVNHQEAKGLSPLHYCAAHKNREIATAILHRGGRLDIADVHGNQPLWTAVLQARGGEYPMAELFIEHGADPHHKNRYGKSPMDLAIEIKSETLMKIFGRD